MNQVRGFPRWGRKRPHAPGSSGALALSVVTAALAASLPAAAQTPGDPPPAPPAAVQPAPPAAVQPPPLSPTPLPVPAYAPPPSAYFPPPQGYYPPPPYLPPPTERRSTAAMAGGIVALSLGGIFVVTSTIAFTMPSCRTTLDSGVHDNLCTGSDAVPVGLLISGLIGVAAGIPLLVYGAQRTDLAGRTTTGRAAPPAVPAWVGMPRGNGWAWTF